MSLLRFWRPLAPGLLAALAIVVGLAVVALGNGLDKLTAGRDGVPAGLWQILLLSSASGVLAFVLVQFVKYQSSVRSTFHRAAVRRFVGTDLNELNTLLRYELADEQWPMGLSTEVLYAASSRQLAAQLSQSLRFLASRGEILSERERERERDRHSAGVVSRAVTGDSKALFRFFRGATSPDNYDERRNEAFVNLMDFIDRRVDTFQIETSNQWRGLLRTMAAVAAASIAAVTASVMDPAPDVILTAAVLGFLTGGPIAWTARDLTRWVERKAEF
jgi:hypothetical protein